MFGTKPQEQETVGNVSTIFQSHCIKDVKKKSILKTLVRQPFTKI